MPTAEEILDGYPSTDSALQENHCIISEDLRTITIPSDQLLLGVTNDEKVRRVWFDMPSECDGLDLTDFTIYVNYRNARNLSGRYRSVDKVVTEGLITFSWVVARNATTIAGDVMFSVCLRKYEDDNVTVLHEFNTLPATGIVGQGLSVDEDVVVVYRDEVNELLENIDISPDMIGLGIVSNQRIDQMFN